VLVAFRDRSERQRVEERTRQLVREQFARAKAEFQHSQLRDILAQAPAAICVTRGSRHTIDFVNERYDAILSGREVVGTGLVQALPGLPAETIEALDRSFESGQPYSGSEASGTLVFGQAGEGRFVTFVVQPHRDETELVHGLIFHAVDVTEQVRSRQQLERQTAELQLQHRLSNLLAEVGVILTRGDELEPMLQACAESVVTHTGSALSRIWTLQDGEDVLELRASAGIYTHLDGPHSRIPVGQFKIGRIAADRAPHLTNDVSADPEIADRDWATREGLRAFAGYPLIAGNVVLGVIGTFSRQPLTSVDLQALGSVALSIAIGIQKKRHKEALRLSEEHLRRRAEELARLATALERSNRELDAFAYAASHDLRAPLRGIANLAQWIEEDLTGQKLLSDDTAQMLQLMRSRMHRMEGLIEGLLEYSRAGRVHHKPESVDVGRLVREVVDLLAPPEPVQVVVGPGLPTLRTERLPLQQIFMNLISNGVKHAKRDDAVVEVSVRENGSFYEFTVSDNGIGIPAEFQGRIWGIFQTLEARDKVEGTGIGLALVKKLVESAGGRVWVESKPGEGAAFKFAWPRST
jgi:signal transduction histidine kinase